ncbi:hypothetical protein [Halorubrum trapanicum]|uniref:hypothetical protein n=1 Tax=Halorubrum trapanicum TaxID=29284 RepID=UPI000BBAE1EF|nr:hypothetical protein [Halorubrum trapanicum]
MSEEPKGIRDGVEESKGDLRLILLLNAVLSAWFGWTVVWGLDRLGVTELNAVNVVGLSLLIFGITYLAVLR